MSAGFQRLFFGIMVLVGSLNSLTYQFQNSQFVYEGPYYRQFFHPYMQTIMMFFGEVIVLFVYLFLKFKNPQKYQLEKAKAEKQGKIMKCNYKLFFFLAVLDIVSSTIQFIAFNFIYGSVYVMLMGGSIITTLLFAKFFYRQVIGKNHYIGCVLTIIGSIMVGACNLIFEKGELSAPIGLQVAGYAMLVFTFFTDGLFYALEQQILLKYHVDPLQVVWLEGFFGLCIYGLALPIFSNLSCNFGFDVCVYDESGFGYYEIPMNYFRQLIDNPYILLASIFDIINVAILNSVGMTVSKYINGAARPLGDITRIVIVWSAGLVITVTAGQIYPQYQWQFVNGKAISFQVVGFIFIVIGTFVYNKVTAVENDQQSQQLVTDASFINY